MLKSQFYARSFGNNPKILRKNFYQLSTENIQFNS